MHPQIYFARLKHTNYVSKIKYSWREKEKRKRGMKMVRWRLGF